MKSLRRSLIAWFLGATLLVAFAASPAAGPTSPVSKPFAPEWGMLAGWDVFTRKGCGKCHALRGFGAGVGPDLGRIETGKSFFDVAAAMWNHLPRMVAKMREVNIERPTFTARELSDLIAFLFTAQYYDELGDPRVGQTLYAAKGCVTCHEVGGKGGRVGPGLDFLRRANSPVVVAAAMWNHGPEMADTMQAKGMARPTFQGRELVDLIAYIVSAAKSGDADGTQVIPGAPERGERLFAEKQCELCHAVGGKGRSVGPDLGRPRHHMSLTRFAALMWNHGPPMWMRMRERGMQIPRVTGQEMAHLVAYLYTSHYFDQNGDPGRGRSLLKTRGCLSCHSLHGKGGKVSADFAGFAAVRSPASLVAAMWNHCWLVEMKPQKEQVSWPRLSGQEVSDISAYLATLAQTTSPRRPSGSR